MPPPAALPDRVHDRVRPGDLLDLWERAARLAPVERALALATSGLGSDDEARGTGGPVSEDDLRGQPVGRTHGLLLALHERLRGPTLDALASCPTCAARVELSVATTDLLSPKPGRTESVVVHGPYVITWRSPTPDDLIATAGAAGSDRPAALAARCLSVTTDDGAPVALERLDDAAAAMVDDLLADADPLAEVVALVCCLDCGADFEVDLDPGVLVWAEVEAAAHRLLHDVDVLARAYGWTQTDVLALGASRRAAYVSLVLDGVP